MRAFRKFLAVLLAVILISSLSACNNNGSVIDFTCFNTYVHIQTNSSAISKDTENKIKSLFSQLETEFDCKKESSIIYKFNNAKSGEKISISNHAVNIFEKIKYSYDFTGGAFDPTVYPLTHLWGFAPYNYTPNFTPPTEQEINDALAFVGFDKVVFDKTKKTISKTQDGVKLDLGGIVKGYAVDMANEILSNDGHKDGYISIGGSSLSLLKVDSLGIRHPRKNSGESIISVNLKNKDNISVSTSGDYEKFHKDKDGKKYCHIIDAKTGYPTNAFVASVTVLGIDGTIADALTTAGCLKNANGSDILSSELGLFLKEIVKTYPKSQVFAIYSTDQEKVILTNAEKEADFTIKDSEYSVVNF